MNWFKHDSNSTMDSKIRKLIIKYGAVGYAVYFHCLELITECVNENNITFELEHDAEIIADDLKINGTSEKSGRELTEEIMRYMVELKLFEENNGHIFCFKLLKRLDTSMTSSPKLRTLISSAKDNHDKIMTNNDNIMMNNDNIMQDKIRKDKIRKDNNNILSEKPPESKKEPLINREPKNDYEKVEKTYLLLWKSLYDQHKVATEEPITLDYKVIRKLESNLFEKKISAETIQGAINNSVNNDFVIKNGYSLQVILSKNVINQLINGACNNSHGNNNLNFDMSDRLEF